MSQHGLLRVRTFKPAKLAVAIRIRLNERDFMSLADEDQQVSGCDQGALAHAAALPANVARLKFHADQRAFGIRIDEIAYLDHAAVMAGHLLLKENFLRLLPTFAIADDP